MRKVFFLIALLYSTVFSLEKKPWFGNVYEFSSLARYEYNTFSSIEGIETDFSDSAKCHLLHFALAFPYSSSGSIDGDMDFRDTPFQDFTFSSIALQLRHLWWNDIVGDPLSLATSASIRYVTKKSVKDVSSIYFADGELEVSLSLGKEFIKKEFWFFRIWQATYLGIGNKGFPWLRVMLSFDGNVRDKHRLSLFAEGDYSFGKKDRIKIDDFEGYSLVNLGLIDLGVFYKYKLNVFGYLILGYKRRVLAHLAPKKVDFFSVALLLPFSF